MTKEGANQESPEVRFYEELSLALRVPYPLIFVETQEEPLLYHAARDFSRRSGRPLWTWSLIAGLQIGEAHAQLDLAQTLERLHKSSEPALLVVLEPGDELHSQKALRLLQEITQEGARRYQTVLVLSALVKIPPRLSRDSAQLRAPLPSRETLFQVLQEVLPVEEYGLIPRERITGAALGLTRGEAYRAFARARLKHTDQGGPLRFPWESLVLTEKRRAIGKDDVATFVETDLSLDAVGGLEELKEWLDTRKAAFSREAREYGLPIPRGLLLVGVQGCGKSLVAKAVAQHWGLPLLRLDVGAIFAGIHAPDAALNRALLIAETLAPSILWTDEIEKGFGVDGDATTQRVLGTLLTWLQEKKSEVFFVSTANSVTQLPPELLRKGRFDELFFVDLPDRQAREQIFTIHLEKRGREVARFDLDSLGEKTEHFSGAEIEEVVTAGLYEAFAEGRDLVTQDMIQVVEETVPLYDTREDEIKALREWARTRTRMATRDRRLVDFFDAGEER